MKIDGFEIINTLDEDMIIHHNGESYLIPFDEKTSDIFSRISNDNNEMIMSKDMLIFHDFSVKKFNSEVIILVSPITCAYWRLSNFKCFLTKTRMVGGILGYSFNNLISFK